MEMWQAVAQTMAGLTTGNNVDAVFGTPEPTGAQVLIPVAERMHSVAADGRDRMRERPIAHLIVSEDGTRVAPICDTRKLTIAGGLLALWTAGWATLVWKLLHDRR